jgi:large subunit ribosomal protein L25
MSQKIVFAATPRTVEGKKVKHLRPKMTPGNISGDLEKSMPVTVDAMSFKKLYEKVGDSGLFYLKVEGETKDRPVLVSEVQHNPVSNAILHVAFRQVDLSEKVTAEVPVETIGEFAVREAVLVTVHNVVEVEALPQDLPEKFEINVAEFTKIGDMVTFAQLNYDKSKVTLKIEAEQLETPVVMVQELRAAEPEPVAEVAPVAEGAAPAAGAEAPATAAAPEKKEEKK